MENPGMQNHYKKIKSILQIPLDSRIAIYGRGNHGLRLLELIEKFRPDLSFKCFLEDMTTGESSNYGLRTYGMDRLQNIEDQVDYVVIPALASQPHIPSMSEKKAQEIEEASTLKCLILTVSVFDPPSFCTEIDVINLKDNGRIVFFYSRDDQDGFDSTLAVLTAERPDLEVVAAIPFDSLKPDAKSPGWRTLCEQYESIDMCIVMLTPHLPLPPMTPGISDETIIDNEVRLLRMPLLLLNIGAVIPSSYFTADKMRVLSQFIEKLSPVDAKVYKTRVNLQTFNPPFAERRPCLCNFYPNRAPQYLDYIARDRIKTILHAGTYDGYTNIDFITHLPNVKSIYSFDFSDEYMKKAPFLRKTLSSDVGFHFVAAALDKSTGESFFVKNPGSYHLKEGASGNSDKTPTVAIDDFVESNKLKVDYIALDVEGAESDALLGALKTIANQRPQLCISIYHRTSDVVDIPVFMLENLQDYVFRIGHYSKFARTETLLYAIPKEIYTEQV